MKAEYKNDADKGRGYGVIIINEALLPSAPWKITLLRSSDAKYLTENGRGQWVGEKTFIPLEGKVSDDGSSLELFLDPKVVDSLDQQEQYKISLKGSDGEEQVGRLKLGPIAFSLEDRLDNTAKIGPEKHTAPNAEVFGKAPSGNERPIQKDKRDEAPPKSAPPVQPAPAPENVEEESPELNFPPKSPSKKSKVWLYALLALLVLGALLAWAFMNFSSTEDKVSLSAEEQVKQFFSQPNPTAEAAFALAKSLPGTSGADQDAIYRLYYFAADKDYPQAFLPYANFLNPALPNLGSINKNAPEAMKAYEEAARTNPEEARQAIDNMLGWLEKQAAEGNAEAAEWLRQLKK